MRTLVLGVMMWLAVPSALRADSISYLDGDFSGWESFVVTDTSDRTGTIARMSTGGNAGAYQQHTFFPRNQSVSAGSHRVALASLGGIVYAPSATGAIESLVVGYDLTRISNNPAFSHAGQVRPYIRQDDVIFSLFFPGAGAVEDPASVIGGWTPYDHTSTSASDWLATDGSGRQPDFSGTGTPLQFGYRILLTTLCDSTSCIGATLISGIDNYRVTVRYADPAVVPEPALLLLMGTGLLANRVRRRLTRRTAGMDAPQ